MKIIENDFYSGGDQHLEALFESAKNQAPKYSFTATEKALAASLVGTTAAVLTTKIIAKSFIYSKTFIMSVSVIALLTTGTLLYTGLNSEATNNNNVAANIHKAEMNVDKLKATFVPVEVLTPKSKVFSVVSPIPLKRINALSLYGMPTVLPGVFGPLRMHVPLMDTILKNQEVVHYSISNRTTEEELIAMKDHAKQIGLDFNYTGKFKNGQLREIEVKMKSINPVNDKSTQQILSANSNKNETFEIEFLWILDEKGRFDSFGDMNDKMDSSQLTRIEELEMELMDSQEEMAHLHEKIELEMLEKEEELEERTMILERRMEEKELEMELLTEEIEMEIEELELEEINYPETRQEGLVTKRVKYVDDSSLTTKTYYITQSTSVEELNEIQAAATKAGIKMEYTAKVNKDRIKKIDLEMSVPNGGVVSLGSKMSEYINITVNKGEAFSVPIIWRLDETGKAVDFGSH